MASLLLEARGDINRRDEHGQTPLFFMFADDGLLRDMTVETRLCITRLFLLAQADVNAVDADGRSPLHMACHFGRAELVEMLVRGCTWTADAVGKDKDNKGPLDYCRKGTADFPKIRDLLQEAEASMQYSGKDVYRLEMVLADSGKKDSSLDPSALMREWE